MHRICPSQEHSLRVGNAGCFATEYLFATCIDIYPMCPQLDITKSFDVVKFTILFYDYMLTFDREIELFWRRPRLSWPFLLFVAIRYITVFGYMPLFVYSFWNLFNRWCSSLLLYYALLVIVTQEIIYS